MVNKKSETYSEKRCYMKKIISLFLVSIMIFSSFALMGNAVSINESKEALREQFEYGKGPKTGLYSVDYRYYSPVKGDEDTKYPLVIWAHGHSHGQYDGFQIISNDIVNWSSDEYQTRSENGFYVIAVRAPENIGISWGDDMIAPLKAAIDDFIKKNSEHIDTTKIYMGGFSLGGMMTYKMAINYPDMFAAIFPICPAIDLSEQDAKRFADVPVWMVAGEKDHLVSYTKTVDTWEKICSTSNVAQECRFSTLSKVCMPDGSRAPTEHYSWEAVTADMFSADNGDYPNMTTVDGNGNTVVLSYPNGMVSWLTALSSDYSPETDNSKVEPSIDIFNIIKAPIMIIYFIFRNLLRPIFG